MEQNAEVNRESYEENRIPIKQKDETEQKGKQGGRGSVEPLHLKKENIVIPLISELTQTKDTPNSKNFG